MHPPARSVGASLRLATEELAEDGIFSVILDGLCGQEGDAVLLVVALLPRVVGESNEDVGDHAGRQTVEPRLDARGRDDDALSLDARPVGCVAGEE